MEILILASSSKGNCYKISDGKTSLLLDAGIPAYEIKKRLNFRLCDISGCLISHEHQDHIKATADLARMGINIFTSKGTLDAAELTGHRFKVVEAGKQFAVGTTLKVLPFNLEHDATEPLGFLVYSTETEEKLLYITDSYYIRYCFNGLNYILCECNYSKKRLYENIAEENVDTEFAKRLIKSHMSIEHFAEFLKANTLTELKQLYLIHISDGNGDEAEFLSIVKPLIANAEVIFA